MLKYLKLIILLFAMFINMVIGKADTLKHTIAIDLDGVLDDYTGYTSEIPAIRKGAKNFIIELSKDYELVLFTTRSSKLATKWLIENKIDKYFKDVTNVKPLAVMYIDDRAVKFNGDYNQTLQDIKNFKVYYHQNL